jgi:hypothetical protein
MSEPVPGTPASPNRRRFLQITAVGTTAAATGLAAIPTADALTSFIHPGVLHKLSDIQRMRTRIAAGTEPWLSGWNVFRANAYSQSAYAMLGPLTTIDRGTTEIGNWEFWNDCNAAYQNALMWNLTGTTAHATKVSARTKPTRPAPCSPPATTRPWSCRRPGTAPSSRRRRASGTPHTSSPVPTRSGAGACSAGRPRCNR